MSTLQDILTAAQALPPSEKVQLIGALWDSVSPNDWPPPSAELLAEVQRRSADIDAGIGTLSSWNEVRERARQKAGLDGSLIRYVRRGTRLY